MNLILIWGEIMDKLIERLSALYDQAYYGQEIQFPDWHIQKELCDVLLMCKDKIKELDATSAELASTYKNLENWLAMYDAKCDELEDAKCCANIARNDYKSVRERNRELQAENERLKMAIQEWVDGKCISEKYLLMIGNLQNERDTAVADLKSLSNDNSLCGICKFSECPLSDGICADCKGYPHLIVSNFEWRGEENLNG